MTDRGIRNVDETQLLTSVPRGSLGVRADARSSPVKNADRANARRLEKRKRVTATADGPFEHLRDARRAHANRELSDVIDALLRRRLLRKKRDQAKRRSDRPHGPTWGGG